MKRTKGITLLALVITIVIMLLLAGVALQMAMGENGLIVKSTQAKKRTSKIRVIRNSKIKLFEFKNKSNREFSTKPRI